MALEISKQVCGINPDGARSCSFAPKPQAVLNDAVEILESGADGKELARFIEKIGKSSKGSSGGGSQPVPMGQKVNGVG